jgi:hypothetical protein
MPLQMNDTAFSSDVDNVLCLEDQDMQRNTCLFTIAFNYSYYIVSDDGMISEYWIRKDVERSGSGLA